LKDEGVMAIICPRRALCGVPKNASAPSCLRRPHRHRHRAAANLFYSTGIPVCILVLKKCKKPDDVLFINAAEHFVKGKRQEPTHRRKIAKIINTYQFRTERDRYSKRIGMERIAEKATTQYLPVHQHSRRGSRSI